MLIAVCMLTVLTQLVAIGVSAAMVMLEMEQIVVSLAHIKCIVNDYCEV